MSWAEDNGYDAFDEDDLRRMQPNFEYETGIWETADGKRLKISEMEVSHIKNCIAYLNRAKESTNDPDNLLEIGAKLEEFEEELEKRSHFNNKELF